MSARHRSVDIQIFGSLGGTPRAVAILIGQQKLDAALDCAGDFGSLAWRGWRWANVLLERRRRRFQGRRRKILGQRKSANHQAANDKHGYRRKASVASVNSS
jgi:hypothetical protein